MSVRGLFSNPEGCSLRDSQWGAILDAIASFFADAAGAGSFRVIRADGWAGPDELSRNVAAAAVRLADAGVGPGDEVLYQSCQREEALVLFWAAMARGAVFAPLDETWPDYMVERATAPLAPRVVVCNPDRLALYRRLFPDARHVSLTSLDDEPEDRVEGEWRAWLGTADRPLEVEPIAPSAPAAYLFTSGSTGAPKAVVLSRGALAHGAELTLRTFEWRPGERLVNLPEPHTMSGLRNGLVAAPRGGLAWIPFGAPRRSNIFALLEGLEESRADRLVVGPALVRQLVQLGERVDPQILASVKAIYCTGAMLSPLAAEAFHARFGIPIVNYYGLTETGGICVSQRLGVWRVGDRSIGQAAGADLRVAPEVGAPAAEGVGELQVRSPQLMSAYLGDAAASAARFDGPWLRTGDLARIEPDGRVYLIGRSDGFIKTASTDRVAPEEVEGVLEEHPAVAEAAVLGEKTDQDHERIAALVVLRPGAGGEDIDVRLATFVRERLGPARTPSRVVVVQGLPRRDTGKIIRGELQGVLDGYA